MSREQITVLCGVSGAGKTHYFEEQKVLHPKSLCADIAEVRKRVPFVDWGQATVIVAAEARRLLSENPTADGYVNCSVYVEGYFLPSSPSLSLLEDELQGYDLKFVFLHASKETCERRLLLQAYNGGDTKENVQGRTAVMKRCWDKADRKFKDLTGSPDKRWTLVRTDGVENG